MQRRPTAADYRRRRAIAGLIVIGLILLLVLGGALVFSGGGDDDSSSGLPASSAAPSTGAPTTTLVPPTVLAVGDSVMEGARDVLRQTLGPDTTIVDTEESRQFDKGVDVIQGYADRNELKDEVVVQLGTNGTINPDDFDRMMNILKNVKRVLLVNANVPRPWEEQVNDTLADGAKRFKNAKLVDWHSEAGGHPDWFYDDGIHLRPDGAIAYAQFIQSQL
jgi:lysophospholipase L1-like esterase